jgi:hypothetical protein
VCLSLSRSRFQARVFELSEYKLEVRLRSREVGSWTRNTCSKSFSVALCVVQFYELEIFLSSYSYQGGLDFYVVNLCGVQVRQGELFVLVGASIRTRLDHVQL